VVNDTCWIRYSGIFVPDESGDWQFGMMIAGSGNLFLDEKLIIDLSTDPEQGDGFFGLGTIYTRTVVKDLEKGREYKVELRIDTHTFQARGSPFAGCYGGLTIGAAKVIDESEAIAHAVKVASEADGKSNT
jgi:beta-glucosidase